MIIPFTYDSIGIANKYEAKKKELKKRITSKLSDCCGSTCAAGWFLPAVILPTEAFREYDYYSAIKFISLHKNGTATSLPNNKDIVVPWSFICTWVRPG